MEVDTSFDVLISYGEHVYFIVSPKSKKEQKYIYLLDIIILMINTNECVSTLQLRVRWEYVG